jgi:hypothetical protein
MLPCPSAQALKAVLSIDRTECALSDKLNLEAKLLNASTEAIVVYGRLLWGYGGGFVLRVFDGGGAEVFPAAHDDDLVIPSTLSEPASFVSLAPDHFLGVMRADRASDLFNRPGAYRIRVEYRSPVPLKYKNQPNFWSMERGVILSATIEVRITSAPSKRPK